MNKGPNVIAKIERSEAEDERNDEGENVENFCQTDLSNSLSNVDLANQDVAKTYNGDGDDPIEDKEEESKCQMDATISIIIPDACGILGSGACQHPEVSHTVVELTLIHI